MSIAALYRGDEEQLQNSCRKRNLLIQKRYGYSTDCFKGQYLLINANRRIADRNYIYEEDLSKVSELKIEECKVTTSSASNLKLLQTTRLKAIGKYEGNWIDLTDFNVVWSTDPNSGLNIYQGGLLQRMSNSSKTEIVSAKTLTEVNAEPIKIAPAK